MSRRLWGICVLIALIPVLLMDGRHVATGEPAGVSRTPGTASILMYHEVSDVPERLCVAPEDFRAQMDWLVAAGYETMTLTTLRRHLALGRPLPEKAVVITFDDGYASIYGTVYPILAERGLTATFFIPSGLVGQPGRVNWTQLVEMSEAAFEIGSHSVSHCYLADVPARKLKDEVTESKVALERELGLVVEAFSYPYGQWDHRVVEAVQAAGYRVAVTVDRGWVTGASGVYWLPRLPVYRSDGLQGFISLLTCTEAVPDSREDAGAAPGFPGEVP